MHGHCEHGWNPRDCETCRRQRAIEQGAHAWKIDPTVDRQERRRVERQAKKQRRRDQQRRDKRGS